MLKIDAEEFCELFDDELKNSAIYNEKIKIFKATLTPGENDRIEEAFELVVLKLAEIFYIKGFKNGIDFIVRKDITID
jgi:predicted ATP-grasp superfamily ATP-dependent carboligase